MALHFSIRSRSCIFCHGSVQDGLLVTDEGASLLPVRSDTCPNQACPVCKRAPLAFLSHSFCFDLQIIVDCATYLRHDAQKLYSASASANTRVASRFWELGQALLPLLPVTESHEIENEFNILKSSFNEATLSRIPSTCQHTEDCACCLLRNVALLPQELLEYISSFILPSPAQKLFVAFGDTLNILMELETNPAYKITFSYQDTIFMSQIQFGGTTYITRLHNDQTQNSTLLFKSGVARPNFAVIWLNMIGITHVEFLSSMDRITPRQVDREWVYAISISDSIHVQRKGAFLARIDNTAANQRHILWDSWKAPFLRKIQLPASFTGDKVLLHYVSLDNIRGISLAFDSVRLLAIISHTDASDDGSQYAKASGNATWVHCPLRPKTEKILEVWSIQHQIHMLDWTALMIKTTLKHVWLGAAFLSEEFHQLLQRTLISLQPVHALYYSAANATGNRIIGAIPEEGKCLNEAELSWPQYRNNRPYGYKGEKLQWYYSEASLESVERVQLCVEHGFCIGIRLQYKEFDKTLGHYRLDRESECFDNPQWGTLIEHRDSAGNLHVKIKFSKYMPKCEDCKVFRMAGVMCWWFGPGRSEVAVLSGGIS